MMNSIKGTLIWWRKMAGVVNRPLPFFCWQADARIKIIKLFYYFSLPSCQQSSILSTENNPYKIWKKGGPPNVRNQLVELQTWQNPCQFCIIWSFLNQLVKWVKKFWKHNKIVKNAGVAQLVEHLTRNEKVTCSSHATSSKTPSGFCQRGFLLPIWSTMVNRTFWRYIFKNWPLALPSGRGIMSPPKRK